MTIVLGGAVGVADAMIRPMTRIASESSVRIDLAFGFGRRSFPTRRAVTAIVDSRARWRGGRS